LKPLIGHPAYSTLFVREHEILALRNLKCSSDICTELEKENLYHITFIDTVKRKSYPASGWMAQ
jgi:hypothetical protein